MLDSPRLQPVADTDAVLGSRVARRRSLGKMLGSLHPATLSCVRVDVYPGTLPPWMMFKVSASDRLTILECAYLASGYPKYGKF